MSEHPTGAPPKGSNGSNKRRRRRNGRRNRRNAHSADVSQTVALDTATQQPQSGAQKETEPTTRQSLKQSNGESVKNGSGKRRRTRRPGRKDTHGAKHALPAANNHTPANSPPRKRNASKSNREPRANAYAALDLGTNNCRLLIAMPGQGGDFRVVGSFSRIVRLGDGLEHTGALGEDAMDRALEALSICAHKLQDKRIKRARLIATEACRRAKNGQTFLDRVRDTTGIELEIVDRETEARLAVSGCGSLLDPTARGAVLFDIGGGSTEIALLDMRSGRQAKASDHIRHWTSLPVGVVTLADRFGGRDVTPRLYAEMVEAVEQMLESFQDRFHLKKLHGSQSFHLLGTSGTVTTLAGIHLNLPRYDRRRVDGIWMNNGQLDAMIQKLLGMNFDQRRQNPCIGEDRADLVLAGCAILDAIRNTWPAPRLRVADRGLREGLLMEMMGEDDAWGGHLQRGTNSGHKPRRGRPSKHRGRQPAQAHRERSDP